MWAQGAQFSLFKHEPLTCECDIFLKVLNNKYISASFNFLAFANFNGRQFSVWSVMANPRGLKPESKYLQFKNVSHVLESVWKNKPGAPGAYIASGPENVTLPKRKFHPTDLLWKFSNQYLFKAFIKIFRWFPKLQDGGRHLKMASARTLKLTP